MDALAIRSGGIYCDCTLGRGGHTAAILERGGAECTVIAIDRDPAAIAAGRQRWPNEPRLRLVHGAFGDVKRHLEALGVGKVDGFLLDLGVSSPQLDEPARGFSFQREGPLDMRMDSSAGPTALDLLRVLPQPEIARILRDYGEERHHQKLSRRIKEAVGAGELTTTLDLAKLVASTLPAAEVRKSRIHPATRTFQALRIAVNRELDELAQFLADFPDLLAPRGRCVVISFHSLEDRMVKHRFRDLAWTSSLPPRLAEAAGERVLAVCEAVTRKAVFASDTETETNPRARSARLRACERTTAPHLPAQS